MAQNPVKISIPRDALADMIGLAPGDAIVSAALDMSTAEPTIVFIVQVEGAPSPAMVQVPGFNVPVPAPAKLGMSYALGDRKTETVQEVTASYDGLARPPWRMTRAVIVPAP